MMIRVNILKILEAQGHSKYWLFVRSGMNYRTFNRLLCNETRSIRYETIEMLCRVLHCTPSQLFTVVPDPDDPKDPSGDTSD